MTLLIDTREPWPHPWISLFQADARFFGASRCEQDALRFQVRHVGDELSRWTLALCATAVGNLFY